MIDKLIKFLDFSNFNVRIYYLRSYYYKLYKIDTASKNRQFDTYNNTQLD